ncbi:MAG: 5' nucleotidase, NT5C type [Cellulosilyticaceae bacterium]
MEHRKPVLLIDQDDVLAEYIQAVTLTFNEKYQTEFTEQDCDRWDLVSVFGEEILDIMHEPHLFKELKPVEDAIQTFKRLYESELFEMYIVTAAQPGVVEAKCEWLKEHMPFLPLRQFIVCSAKDMIKGDYLLDDGMHNIEAFQKAGGTSVIFNRPHNADGDEQYVRINDWLQFESYIINECYPHLVREYFESKMSEIAI